MRPPVDRRIPASGLGAWLARRSDGARLHAGVDLRVDPEQPVRAPEAGRVVETFESNRPADARRYSRPAGWSGYGPRGVLMAGRSGVFHLLAHLDHVDVREGDELEEGDTVGRGSVVHHVHWEVREMARPPAGHAVVEVTLDPGAWLRGERVPWDGQCPEHPADDHRTPRRCRPRYRGTEVARPPSDPPEAAPSSEGAAEGGSDGR